MHAPPETIVQARRLRRKMTPPEAKLWMSLRRHATGLKFRRQHPLGLYVLDFYCHSARLAVEVDGIVHERADNPERDARRDDWFDRQGIRTLRVAAADVRDDLDGVIALIVEIATRRAPSTTSWSPSPTSSGGGGDLPI
ncbi:MAG TPA: endonuclease domain-containing protein [Thermoanaerobaculia bacterium]|jgi:very-short-patch-repair endonuclease